MTQEMTVRTPKEITREGLAALNELKLLITRRPEREKLVINGKQYLYFADWQILGIFFGISTSITATHQITREVPTSDGKATMIEVIGYHARAIAMKNGKEISAAEAECLQEEKNWAHKDRFQLLSMVQTRACAKALRNCLQWVVRLPTIMPGPSIAEETAEEVDEAGQNKLP